MKIGLWLLALWVSLGVGIAQKSYQVQGYLLSHADSSAIINASVELYDSASVSLSSDNGYFLVQSPRQAQHITVKYMGKIYQHPIVWNSDSLADLGYVYLNIASQRLAEVKVVSSQAMVRYEAGKAIYNLNSFPGNKGAASFEALNRIPGIKFKPEEGFQLNGFR